MSERFAKNKVGRKRRREGGRMGDGLRQSSGVEKLHHRWNREQFVESEQGHWHREKPRCVHLSAD